MHESFRTLQKQLRTTPPSTRRAAPFVADEKPLWVTVDPGGRITRLGEGAGPMVTAGFYLLSAEARALTPPPELARLRDYLSWLAERQSLYAEIIDTVVDVDRPDDVALAEALGRPRPRDPQGG